MATTTTFKGAPKPPQSGWYYESNRHALAANGIRSGNLAQSYAAPAYTQWGVQNLEAPPVDNTPKTSTGLEDVEAETLEAKPVPKPSLIEQIKRSKAAESLRKARERKAKLYEQVGKEPEGEEIEEEETPEEELEEAEFEETPTAKIGKFLADLEGDYTSQDMVGLSDADVELLAIRFKQQYKDAIFGEPENPFVEEIKKRMQAKADLKREKAEIEQQIRSKPKEEPGLLSELFAVEPEEKGPKGKGFIQELFED
jgi:hypothetical protein